MAKAAPVSAWIGLGSNLGDSIGQLQDAALALEAGAGISGVARSSMYRSAPWGGRLQPAFVNAVVRCRTTLAPLALLDVLLAIETRLGRVRDGSRWGPRLIDLDLLLYGEQVLDVPRLRVPHPHLHERAFVLVPLLELDPGLSVPGLGPARALLQALEDVSLEVLAVPGWPR